MAKQVRSWGGAIAWLALGLLCVYSLLQSQVAGQAQTKKNGKSDEKSKEVPGWKQGEGWGWVWGEKDEVGAFNAMTDQSRLAALSLVKEGKVYDLGVTYSRLSYRWPGHNPCEVMTFRSPEGVKRQKDQKFTFPEVNPSGQAWHSCAIFISDNVGTQIDGLAHVTAGIDNHWYNGYTEKDWGGNFGVRKCDATTIPPVVARGVLLDIAGLKKADALPSGYAITRVDVDKALESQKVEIRPGDVVFFRTGTLQYWGEEGADAEKKVAAHDSAGITLGTAKYLVQNFGVIMIGSDTSGLEVQPAPDGSDSFIPVHNYLLIEQGVHIAEFHNLEELARDKVYEFCYICTTNKIKGATAGFALRPIAIK